MGIPQYGTQSTANTLISRAYTYRNRLRLIFFEFTLRVDPIRDPLPSLHSEDLEKIVEIIKANSMSNPPIVGVPLFEIIWL